MSDSPPQRPMVSPEYSFNFNPPPPLYGHPSTPAGHAYSGMVGSHEMGRVMYQGGPTGMSDGRPMSVPALTPGLSSHELQWPATAPGGVGTGTSSAQNTSGPPKSMKISQVLSEMTSFNRWLAQAEDSELQHANELRAVETKCVQHVEAVKTEFKAKIKSLEEQFEQKVASLLVSKSHIDVGDGSEDETNEEFEQDVEKLEKSALAFGNNGLKVVVHMVFQMLMGSAKLTIDALPSYPSDENKWLLDPATNKHLMRFCWTESHQHSDNHANILRIITYICQHGATVCTGTGPTLRDISDEDLRARVVKKYQDLQKNLWKAGRLSGHPVVPLTGAASTVEYDLLGPSAQPVAITTTSCAKLQSHARGMSRFLAAVDEAADPHPPPRFTARVKVEWLVREENKKYDSPSFILDNGCAWGDPKDPEEMLAGQKRVKEQKRVIAAKKRMKIEEMEAKKKENGTKKGKGKSKATTDKGKG
ncbi:hypothetical protein BDR06DRAFT_1006860 [Suillus hirtellus]|nr:hypothetical protein BDR06DRAFT_1006860 [Suillus hirtellus]